MHQVQKLVRKICRAVGTPAANAVLRLAEAGEWTKLQQLRLGPPETYASHDAYRDDLLVFEFVRKLEIPGNAAARKAAAVEEFYKTEAQCLRTNSLFSHLDHGYLTPNDVALVDFITSWRANVTRVLGPLPPRLYPRYSPGATLSDQGMQITIPDKMSSLPTCYTHSEDVLQHTVANTEQASLRQPRLVRGNRFFTVPKDGSKDRGCCVEASWNVMAQLDVGKRIRDRYNRYYEVRLQDMKPVHMAAARMASVSGEYATIDLSSASDTVAKRLVKAVLPSMWYELLESLRAKNTCVDGKTVHLQKFSSMGNGFTFELETLLFRTLAETLGARHDDCIVFGDDIIVASALAPSMIKALKCFGFTPNARKTFCEGPFRESCGGDYFKGHDVRAVYLKTIPDDPVDWIATHNRLFRWDTQRRLTGALRYCQDQVPTSCRHFGPDDGADRWFAVDDPIPVAFGPTKRKDSSGVQPGTPGYWGIIPQPRQILVSHRYFRPDVVIACALMGVGERIGLRDTRVGYQRSFQPMWGLSEKATMKRFPGLIS